MADGAVHRPPYTAAAAVLGWLRRRDVWHRFHGYCLSQGAHILRTQNPGQKDAGQEGGFWHAGEVLDLALHWRLTNETDDDRAKEAHKAMLGEPTRAAAVTPIVPGLRTPSWYGTEQEASDSSFAAAMMLGAGRKTRR